MIMVRRMLVICEIVFFGIDVGRRLNFHMNDLCECVWKGIQINIAITRTVGENWELFE